jgi:hypothetical protein
MRETLSGDLCMGKIQAKGDAMKTRLKQMASHPGSRPWAALAVLGGLLALSSEVQAQYVPDYFPEVPGFDRELGVTVASRSRPLYEAPGIRAGSFVIRPSLDESTGYNDNVLGSSNGPGSWLLETRPSVSINSDWSRNRIGALLSLDNLEYFNAHKQSRTDWTVGIGGGYTIGRSDLDIGYTHQSLHASQTEIGALPSDSPIPYTIDDIRADYTFDLGRFKIRPNVDYTLYRFGNTTIGGVPSNQSYRNRNVLVAGGEFRYELAPQRNLLLVLQGIDSEFQTTPVGSQPLGSKSGQALAGIDYQYSGSLRFRALAGLEVRSFDSSQFKTRVEPIAEGDVIWTPTGLTTVTGSLIRTIEDPIQENNSGFTFTWARARVDHELYRNILLQANTGVQVAEYFQGGGTTTNYYVGGGATWLINRNLRLTGEYRYTTQSSGSTVVATTPSLNSLQNGSYSQNLILVSLHVGL